MIGHPVAAAGVAVSMLTGAYAPAHVDVLAGDTVTWGNGSVRRHTVTAIDGSWGSGSVFAGQSYAHRFDVAGDVPYFCQVHPWMRGDVAVHRLLLTTPHEPGAPGRAYTLAGRAALPAGSDVTLEGDPGTGFVPVGRATVGADGAFRAAVTPSTAMSYRAVAGAATSPAVRLMVLDRHVTASASRRGSRTTVRVRVDPASPHATVVLQLHLRERFGWWPVRRVHLDHHSQGTFRLHVARRLRARAVLTLADGATPLATSTVFRVGATRSARTGAARSRPLR
jgi:plastocyanin